MVLARRHVVHAQARQILKDPAIDFSEMRGIELATHRVQFKLDDAPACIGVFELGAVLRRQGLIDHRQAASRRTRRGRFRPQ